MTIFQTSRASSSRALFSTEPAGLEVGYLEIHPTHATFSVETFPRKPPKTSHRVIMENELHRRRKMPATVFFGEIPKFHQFLNASFTPLHSVMHSYLFHFFERSRAPACPTKCLTNTTGLTYVYRLQWLQPHFFQVLSDIVVVCIATEGCPSDVSSFHQNVGVILGEDSESSLLLMAEIPNNHLGCTKPCK